MKKIIILLFTLSMFTYTKTHSQSLLKTVTDSTGKKEVVAKKLLPHQLISVAPFSFINKLKFQYERVINNKISAGVGGYIIYSDFGNLSDLTGSNFKKKGGVNAFARWYPLGNAPTGIYFQPKLTAHYCSMAANYYQWTIDTAIGYYYEHITGTQTILKSFGVYAASVDLGGQFLIANCVPIDISVGLRVASAETVSLKSEETIHGEIYILDKYTELPNMKSIGMPGFPIGFNFNIGFAF